MNRKNVGNFTSTIFIDDNNIDMFTSGQTQLKTGQWVKFSWVPRRSRWVGVSRAGVIHAYHGPHAGHGSSFARRVRAYKIVNGELVTDLKRG